MAKTPSQTPEGQWRVFFRAEVIESGEINLVTRARLKELVRRLRRNPYVIGKPLERALTGCWTLRPDDDTRMVYRMQGEEVVEILAIGRRRESGVYALAERRI